MDKKIVVLFLGRTGVGPIYTYDIVNALSKYIKVFVILSSYIDNRNIWDKESKNNKNIQINYIKTYRSKLTFLLSFFNIFRFTKLIKTINGYQPNMVYSTWVHYWDPLIYPFLKCKIKIKTIHDIELKKGEKSIGFRLLNLFSFKYADKYIILRNRYKSVLISKGIQEKDIIVIPHTYVSYFDNMNYHKLDIKFHNKILFFGRIVEYKGLNVLLKAMEIVVKQIPGIKLIIAGAGDISKYKRELEILKNNVEIYNYWISNDEIQKYFNMIDILILPYIQASQSGIIPLSFSFAKPVIASDVGAIAEQICNGETGFLIEPNNSEVLANIINETMSSPDMLLKMGKKCHEYYLMQLALNTDAKKIIDLLYVHTS
jgi:glycosyltransferase involved in cell wall biosynthesis